MQILKRVYFDSLELDDAPQSCKDTWSKEFLSNQSPGYYSYLAKDKKHFLAQVSELLSTTKNLQLAEPIIQKLLSTAGSVMMSQLINALLLERTFLINLLQAFAQQSTQPTLSQLLVNPQRSLQKPPSIPGTSTPSFGKRRSITI